jgi:hypothetical protein
MQILSVLEPAIGLVMWQVFLLSWIVFLIFASIDIAINKFEGNQKIFWLLLCIFVPFGWLIYFLIGRKQRIKVS